MVENKTSVHAAQAALRLLTASA